MKLSNSVRISPPNDSIVYTIGRLYVLLDSYLYRTAYKAKNLNPAKFNLLMVVKHVGKENGISQIELGNNLYVSAANITKLIDAVEREGLVSREPSKEDRRINLIKITERGSQLLDEIWPKHVMAVNNILNELKISDKEKLNSLLEIFKAEMDQKIKTNE